jgi:thiol-disulfide isomerase/thioredoxin
MARSWLAVLGVLAGCGPSGGSSSAGYGQRPDWSLTVDGKKVSASDFDGKVLIVDFWATWCPPCRQEIPGFIQLQTKYKEKGLVILGFSFDRDPATHAQWIKQQGLNYLSIFAQTEEVAPTLAEFQKKIGAIEGLPTTIVIDRQGKIVWKHVGYASVDDFEKVLQPLF